MIAIWFGGGIIAWMAGTFLTESLTLGYAAFLIHWSNRKLMADFRELAAGGG